MRWLEPGRHSALSLLAIMGACAALLAWNTVDLAHVAMANVQFLRSYGWMAVMDGGLTQFVEVLVRATVSLVFYLGFKLCEVELIARWRNWRSKK